MLGLGISTAIAVITITFTSNSFYQSIVRNYPYSLLAKYSATILSWRNDTEFAKEIVATYPGSDTALALYIAIQPDEIKLEWVKNIIRHNQHGYLREIWSPHSCALLDDQDFLIELILSGKRHKIPMQDSDLIFTQKLALKAQDNIDFAKKIILDIYADKALTKAFYIKYKQELLQDLDFSKKFLTLITDYGIRATKTYKTIYDDILEYNILQQAIIALQRSL